MYYHQSAASVSSTLYSGRPSRLNVPTQSVCSPDGRPSSNLSLDASKKLANSGCGTPATLSVVTISQTRLNKPILEEEEESADDSGLLWVVVPTGAGEVVEEDWVESSKLLVCAGSLELARMGFLRTLHVRS